ncbi:MAG TPA: KH domain-containing protein [Acidimicrobiales bacterium]|nr:KH domain-containing protein [Acidimicrobiales bacterium]
MSDANDDYVAGDVNTLDDSEVDDDFDDVDGIRDDGDVQSGRAATATAVLEYIAKSLADEPDAVELEVSERGGKVVFSLSVSQSDMGRVIGRRGRTAQAIRALVGAAGARDGVTTSVDIVD